MPSLPGPFQPGGPSLKQRSANSARQRCDSIRITRFSIDSLTEVVKIFLRFCRKRSPLFLRYSAIVRPLSLCYNKTGYDPAYFCERGALDMKKNLLVAQSGGPTAVINASLCGVIREGMRHPEEIGMVSVSYTHLRKVTSVRSLASPSARTAHLPAITPPDFSTRHSRACIDSPVDTRCV